MTIQTLKQFDAMLDKVRLATNTANNQADMDTVFDVLDQLEVLLRTKSNIGEVPMAKYIVKGVNQIDEETDENLYWNNELGWTIKRMATVFSSKEQKTLNLPIGGAWEVKS